SHHRSGTYKGIPANVMSTDNGGVGPDAGALFHHCPAIFALPLNKCPWIDHVGKDAGRPQEHTVLALHTCVNRDVILDFAAVPQLHARGDDHVLSDIAVLPNGTAAHDMGKVPDLRSCTDRAALIHITG